MLLCGPVAQPDAVAGERAGYVESACFRFRTGIALRAHADRLARPLVPVGREPRLGLRVDPSAENAPAREHESVRAVVVDDGQLKVAVERRVGYRLPPHLRSVPALLPRRFDLDRMGRGTPAGPARPPRVKGTYGPRNALHGLPAAAC